MLEVVINLDTKPEIELLTKNKLPQWELSDLLKYLDSKITFS